MKKSPVALCLREWETRFVAVAQSIALAMIDIFYATRDVISNIYVADAVLNFFFVAAWIAFSVTRKVTAGHTPALKFQ